MSSPVLPLKIGDDQRTATVIFSAENPDDYVEPATAVLRVRTDEDLFEYPLALSETEGTWTCEFSTSDIADIGVGNHRAEIYATFDSGEKETFPTRLTIQISPVLSAP